MKKVALILVLAALAILSACNNSGSSNNNNGTYCNSNGQCYNSSGVGACGQGAFPGYSSAYGPYSWTANGTQCWDNVHNIAVGTQYCNAAGAGTASNGLFSPYCTSQFNGLPGAFSTLTGTPFGLNAGLGAAALGAGVCGLGALQWMDPFTGVIQCVPTAQYSFVQPYGVPTFAGGGAYFYARAGIW